MRLRAFIGALTGLALALAFAAQALADEGGEGIYGKTDDKVITNFGYGLMIFFTVLVVGLSIAQHLLDRRKRSK